MRCASLSAAALCMIGGRRSPSQSSTHPACPDREQVRWTTALDAFVQIDAVPYSRRSVDAVDPITGAPLNEEAITVRRGFVRFDANRDAYFPPENYCRRLRS